VITYAEIHYRPSFIPSLISLKQPEIVFDAPSRIEYGYPVPLFLIVKDSDRFPVNLDSIVIHLRYEDGVEKIARFPYNNLKVDSVIWWDSINITPEHPGLVQIDPYLFFNVRGKNCSLHVDNYPALSHSPLIVYVSPMPFPGSMGWYHGDIHCHTFFTADQVEFGAPLEVMAFAAYCMGMKWIAATDHSYDLDDCETDYSENDPLLMKWHTMRKKAELLVGSLTVIPGEEVTCRNKKGKNCHMLALNSTKFIKGTGDGGERGLDSKTEKSIGEAISECMEWGGFACAAHPFEKIPILEKMILGRGAWNYDDIESLGLTGLQIYNGVRDRGFRDGMKVWIRFLLKGHKIYAFGGSDTHGDMNRRRYVWFPLIAISESKDHILGNVRTVVHAISDKFEDITEALKQGHAVVTDGPFIDIEVLSHTAIAKPGDEIVCGINTIRAQFLSSQEFGAFKEGRIIAGNKIKNDEEVITDLKCNKTDMKYHFRETFDMKDYLYIRAECTTVTGKICFTNPIWIV